MATDKNKVIKLAALTQTPISPDQIAGIGFCEEPECGDQMWIYIAVRNQMIIGAYCNVTKTACTPLKAAANAAISLIIDKPVMSAYAVNHEKIAGLLSDDGAVDKEHIHCTMMAELTLKKCIKDFATKKNYLKTL